MAWLTLEGICSGLKPCRCSTYHSQIDIVTQQQHRWQRWMFIFSWWWRNCKAGETPFCKFVTSRLTPQTPPFQQMEHKKNQMKRMCTYLTEMYFLPVSTATESHLCLHAVSPVHRNCTFLSTSSLTIISLVETVAKIAVFSHSLSWSSLHLKWNKSIVVHLLFRINTATNFWLIPQYLMHTRARNWCTEWILRCYAMDKTTYILSLQVVS